MESKVIPKTKAMILTYYSYEEIDCSTGRMLSSRQCVLFGTGNSLFLTSVLYSRIANLTRTEIPIEGHQSHGLMQRHRVARKGFCLLVVG